MTKKRSHNRLWLGNNIEKSIESPLAHGMPPHCRRRKELQFIKFPGANPEQVMTKDTLGENNDLENSNQQY